MNRLEKRHKVSPQCNNLGILVTCQNLRMSASGASDPWELETEALAYLQCCLDTWETSSVTSRYKVFDACVHALIEATLAEVKRSGGSYGD